MKEIFQEFGSAVMAIITGVLILGILFAISVSGHHGILEIAGVATKKEPIPYSSYQDFHAVTEWSQRAYPQVGYETERGRFFADENEDFLGRYFAKDTEGTIYPMNQVINSQMFLGQMYGKIMDIRKTKGASVMSSYSRSNGSLRFPSAGVYEVYFQVRDKENLTSIYRIPIAVDEGRD